MSLEDYVHAIKRHWVIVVLCAFIGVTISGAYVLTAPRSYIARSQIYVSLDGAPSLGDLKAGSEYLESIMNSWAKVGQSELTVKPIVQQLKLDRTVEELLNEVTVVREQNAYILTITVADRQPQTASTIANSVAAQLQSVLPELTGIPNARGGLIKVSQILEAAPPSKATTPNVRTLLTTGILAGLVIGVTFAVALSRPVGHRQGG